MLNRTSKRLILALAVVAGLTGGYFLLQPEPVLVETAIVTRGSLQVTIDEEGETRLRDRYLVTAPVAGEVSRIGLRQGDSVAPGTILAHLVPLPMDARERQSAEARASEAEDAARAAQARVTSARAALAQARRARERALGLALQNAISPAERELVELEEITRSRELESADFQEQAAAHQVQAARAALVAGRGAAIPLRSPVRGLVLRVPQQSSRVVPAGEPLLEVGDCSQLEIVTDLLSSDAVRVRPGAPMVIDGWGGEDSLRGKVRRIEPAAFTRISALGVEEQRVNVIGDLEHPPAALGDGFRVQVHIVVWENANVTQVPSSALFRQGEDWSVFVIQEGIARLRRVRMGHRNTFDAEILEGLSPGERVILNAADRVTDGGRVRDR